MPALRTPTATTPHCTTKTHRPIMLTITGTRTGTPSQLPQPGMLNLLLLPGTHSQLPTRGTNNLLLPRGTHSPRLIPGTNSQLLQHGMLSHSPTGIPSQLSLAQLTTTLPPLQHHLPAVTSTFYILNLLCEVTYSSIFLPTGTQLE